MNDVPEFEVLGSPESAASRLDLAFHWQIDERFIADALDLAKNADVVSLDIFDTALTRLLDSPADVFAEVERRLIERHGSIATGFAAARESAERDARIKHRHTRGAEEVDYAAIYAELPRRLPAFAAHVARAAEIEMEVERSLLVAVPDILELTRRLHTLGKPFIFVSDMYLKGKFLEQTLHANGYSGWQALFVSSETLATKSSGKQWSVLRRSYPQLDRILHIGDDNWADGANPVNRGVGKTLVYVRARSERRVGGSLTPDLLPFSAAQREIALLSRSTPSANLSDAARWRNLGRTMGGIVLAGFLRWLEQRVTTHKIDRLYFCARDGWLVQRGWQVAGLGKRTGIEDHYLCISRRPLNLARGYVESTDIWLPQSLLEFLCSTDQHTTTVRTILTRAGLRGDNVIEEELTAHYGSLDTVLVWPHGVEPLKDVLSRHAERVRAALKGVYDALTGYLDQERLGSNGRTAIVDMGWHATMQRSLQKVLGQRNNDASLRGFYYGLWPTATGNRYAAGPMESAFATDFMSLQQQPEVHTAVDILEELHSAPHGTVVSYEQRDGKWQAIFADSPAEFRQYEAITRHFQDGALETVAELYATGRSGALLLDQITPAAVRAALGAVCMSPSDDEVALIGQLGHCATFDHTHLQPIVAASCPDDEDRMRSLLSQSSWRVGTIRAWLRSAEPSRRQQLRELARQTFHYWDERSLRQFD